MVNQTKKTDLTCFGLEAEKSNTKRLEIPVVAPAMHCVTMWQQMIGG